MFGGILEILIGCDVNFLESWSVFNIFMWLIDVISGGVDDVVFLCVLSLFEEDFDWVLMVLVDVGVRRKLLEIYEF